MNFKTLITLILFVSTCFITLSCGGETEITSPIGTAIIEQKLDISQLDQSSKLIRNVELISNVQEGVQAGMDVLIIDGVITNIQATGVITDQTEEIIDGSGKFLIPGLSDMHTHPVTTGSSARNDLFLFLAHGVTTIRVMWGFNGHLKLRDSIAQGEMIGPNMYVASAGYVGTQPLWPGSIQTANSTEVQTLVQEHKNAGYDFIKVYSGLPLGQYDALMSKAHEVGITPIGHIPASVSLSHAINSSQRSIEHLGRVNQSSQIVADAKANEVWFCPTMAVANRSINRIEEYQNDHIYKALSQGFKTWFNDPMSQPVSTDPTSFVNSQLNKLQSLQELGAPIISGTDMGIRYVLQGKSLHEELEFYVQSGMSPSEALATSTLNAHEFLRQPEAGIISIGNKADLVMLHANPLEDITNVRKIAGVFKSGYYFSEQNISSIIQALGVLNN